MIKENIEAIKIPKGVSLVAVSKGKSANDIKEAIFAGVKIIGESRVQEAEAKHRELKAIFLEQDVELHLIGSLQTNKVRRALEIFDMIQSVDSVKLACEINRVARLMSKMQRVLLQANIGRENQKSGFDASELVSSLGEIVRLPNIVVQGLMCIPPFISDPEQTRPYFREMKALYDRTQLPILSMGMSNDYKIAIEEGSNMVRIGRAIFGERIK
jgi:hypothetical protein